MMDVEGKSERWLVCTNHVGDGCTLIRLLRF